MLKIDYFDSWQIRKVVAHRSRSLPDSVRSTVASGNIFKTAGFTF